MSCREVALFVLITIVFGQFIEVHVTLPFIFPCCFVVVLWEGTCVTAASQRHLYTAR
ncbi:uncharacterized protein BDV14DRAFT_161968 [Aspergillus stella-maris]|uniref:uncharacterized protein n=1 Tax=Aspergillus stella-maris TaxID=1810926 RepID=UPI003CCCE8E2